MEKLKIYITLLLLFYLQSCSHENDIKKPANNGKLLLGSDQLINENLDLIRNKRLGIISNKASVLSNGTLLIDSLKKIDGINIKSIFSPEHGFDVNTSAGEIISDTSLAGLKVFSLYGKTRKPTIEMLKNIDVLIFDLQDIGTRFYTYISTLFYVMQSAGENNIPLIVLDRPNPIGGMKVEGPVLNNEQKSFIGIAPVPVIHGMTIGEIAEIFSGEGWIGKEKSSLKIIKMKNWKRNSNFDDYNLKWVNPSPNIPDVETAMIYPAAGFLEGTNISEGRGTENPFKQIGAPFIHSEVLISFLDSLQHEGLSIKAISFTPENITGKAENPKYFNENCNGISLKISDKKKFEAVEFGIKLIFALYKLYPERFKFDSGYFDKLTGNKQIREMILNKKTPGEIIQSWQPGLNNFLQIRKKYLLY
jgi:uncharacterized protein YbbC (DUF1343 family)